LEIRAAVRTAYESTWTPSTKCQTSDASISTPSAGWPKPDPDLIEKITASGFGLADLWEASPIRIEDNRSRAEELVDMMFPGDPLLCIAKTTPSDAKTAKRSAWRGQLATSALIVPSPMRALTGKSKDGRESLRCLDNTGPRRFLVVEFDLGSIDEQAGLLQHLGHYAPLVLAVHSGGKSLHGWFLVDGHEVQKVQEFFCYAVKLGADPATWSSCQLVRLPDGQRNNGNRQTVYFCSNRPLKQYAPFTN
jgi:hypothetical protein